MRLSNVQTRSALYRTELLFFNHFGHLKLSDDPTPMQVQMRTYEDDVNQTLIEQAERTENPEKEA